ncbi:uncharacterized protein LOC144995093 [Oryzias latipes]
MDQCSEENSIVVMANSLEPEDIDGHCFRSASCIARYLCPYTCCCKSGLHTITIHKLSCFTQTGQHSAATHGIHKFSHICRGCHIQEIVCRLDSTVSGAPDWLWTSSSSFKNCHIICWKPSLPLSPLSSWQQQSI